ncbi:uncharacterized protein LOC110618193 [Manihot esculenta]|uniref:DUF1442 domain-containing protein n=1 Tax=Manihot esculenta TaxID=3983 RepID=A0A2C9VQK2_MANES|nr:uncharacterized protein LOC110618193 [Manihot esculenta]OAY48169.1 hypothetical protein MANES_06G137300v8 [Manihot esculenta]
MGCWSAENATNAYLKTLRMGQKAKEPDVAEFISALAAGNNAQLMVVACASSATSTVLALVAAAHQTGGRVICILRDHRELQISRHVLGLEACHIEFVVGEAQNLLLTNYSEADFVLIDCNLENHERILGEVKASRKKNEAIVVGYNAFTKGSWWSTGSKTQLLPIGEGLLVTRIPASAKIGKRSSHWVVKVDKCTGEEHVFRVRFPQGKQIKA